MSSRHLRLRKARSMKLPICYLSADQGFDAEARLCNRYMYCSAILPHGSFSAELLLPNRKANVHKPSCLYLNVFTPATATPDSKLAVMFWIYGGMAC